MKGPLPLSPKKTCKSKYKNIVDKSPYNDSFQNKQLDEFFKKKNVEYKETKKNIYKNLKDSEALS